MDRPVRCLWHEFFGSLGHFCVFDAASFSCFVIFPKELAPFRIFYDSTNKTSSKPDPRLPISRSAQEITEELYIYNRAQLIYDFCRWVINKRASVFSFYLLYSASGLERTWKLEPKRLLSTSFYSFPAGPRALCCWGNVRSQVFTPWT